MTDEEWKKHWWDIALAAAPRGLSTEKLESWMVLASLRLNRYAGNALEEKRKRYLELAIANGWKRPTN